MPLTTQLYTSPPPPDPYQQYPRGRRAPGYGYGGGYGSAPSAPAYSLSLANTAHRLGNDTMANNALSNAGGYLGQNSAPAAPQTRGPSPQFRASAEGQQRFGPLPVNPTAPGTPMNAQGIGYARLQQGDQRLDQQGEIANQRAQEQYTKQRQGAFDAAWKAIGNQQKVLMNSTTEMDSVKANQDALNGAIDSTGYRNSPTTQPVNISAPQMIQSQGARPTTQPSAPGYSTTAAPSAPGYTNPITKQPQANAPITDANRIDTSAPGFQANRVAGLTQAYQSFNDGVDRQNGELRAQNNATVIPTPATGSVTEQNAVLRGQQMVGDTAGAAATVAAYNAPATAAAYQDRVGQIAANDVSSQVASQRIDQLQRDPTSARNATGNKVALQPQDQLSYPAATADRMPLNRELVNHYRRLANGDDNAARQMAVRDGYSIE